MFVDLDWPTNASSPLSASAELLVYIWPVWLEIAYSRPFWGSFGDITGFILELGTGARGQKTRVLGLPDGRKSFKIGFAVLTQYRRVTDTSQPSFHSKYCAIASVGRVKTRSSADADNGLDAFSGQSRSTNIVPFHILGIVSYCAIVTLSLRQTPRVGFFYDIRLQKNSWPWNGVKGHSQSLRVVYHSTDGVWFPISVL